MTPQKCPSLLQPVLYLHYLSVWGVCMFVSAYVCLVECAYVVCLVCCVSCVCIVSVVVCMLHSVVLCMAGIADAQKRPCGSVPSWERTRRRRTSSAPPRSGVASPPVVHDQQPRPSVHPALSAADPMGPIHSNCMETLVDFNLILFFLPGRVVGGCVSLERVHGVARMNLVLSMCEL